jgi:hypothetical protein
MHGFLQVTLPLLLLCATACDRKKESAQQWAPASESENIDHMITVEERILDLTPGLKPLAATILSKEFPGDEYFTKECRPSVSVFSENIESFEHAKFYIVDGKFLSADYDRFDAEVGFEVLGKTAAGELVAKSGKQHVIWCKQKDGSWIICDWKQGAIKTETAPHSLFQEVLAQAIPDAEQLRRARHSQHEQNIIDLFTKDKFTVTKQIYADYMDLDSTFQHPGLAVVDFDNDGWDDLYVMGRWGKNQMFHNQRDGTFADVAPQIGLDIDGLCTSAIFADFDNDGDADAFIGRSLERSMFLTNENGKYIARAFPKMPLPYLVSTISAVDYDQDGLLDVYLGLYGPPQQHAKVEKWAKQFFPKPMADEIIKREPDSHRYVNRLGPPNLLLKNTGNGNFTVAPEAGDLAEWHDTHQSAWCDFDNDGDPDVYVCNDFAPDHLYRNDPPVKPGGKRKFVDISEDVAGKNMQGFGMGASWGDYDRDGRLDLYVTNMFSKAGRRITDTVEGLDPRVPHSANGSLLFHNDGKKFTQVAGTDDNTIHVAKVGWAYGAQFLDYDNDGWLDIYSASGFYTAPKEIATQKDL